MASVGRDANGRKRILFVAQDGTRKTIRLGKVSVKVAEEIKSKVETINAALITHTALDGDAARWITGIGDELRDKLAAVGLVEAKVELNRDTKHVTLGDWLSRYIAGRTDVKPRTRINLEACKIRLVEFFGKDKPLDSITAGDAKDWEIALKERYARGTIGRTLKRAKQFFQAAIDKELVAKNPFAKIKPPSQVNESRKFFVTLDTAHKVMEACPDSEWRLLFALSRFGGLRCPSEHLALKWTDVDWERNRFRVVSSKKEHLDGGGVRWVPLFPELRPHLEAAFDQAPEGAIYVINRYRNDNQNLRTQFQRIIRRAGLEPWPKLFQNLRATRETELAETYPVHVVCAWIGNTERIAAKHYLQVTEDHFQAASKSHAERGTKSGTLSPENTAQNPAQHVAAPNAHQAAINKKPLEIQGFMRADTIPCDCLQLTQVPPRGLEPRSSG